MFEFQDLGRRRFQADFRGGHLSGEGGLVLIGELDRRLGITERLAGCFRDGREQALVVHKVPELIRQRLYGLVAGYEDLNDHDRLRCDPLMAAVVGKKDPLGQGRVGENQGKALAGKSTLNRLEITNAKTGEGSSSYHKISADHEALEKALIELGVNALPEESTEVILDFDATDDPVHGMQEGRFFHGYYKNYCFLPLYCFAGEIPLYAKLRKSDRDASKGTVEALKAIVPVLRRRFETIRIVVRGDSGFARDEIMNWCEENDCYYCLGLAKNARLNRMLEPALIRARERVCLCGYGREFTEFDYRTRESWSRERRVIGKAEITRGKENPRYVVTNLAGVSAEAELCGEQNLSGAYGARALYEEFYCARGEMENRIKEQQMDMFSDRTSSAKMVSNQLRLWFSTFAYLLAQQLRVHALKGTKLARATVGTIRTRLLKVAASIRVSVRRVHVSLCSAFPLQEVFASAYQRLRAMPEPG